VSKDVETVERVIAAPPEKIFALLKDATRHKDFDGSGTVREAQGSPEPLTLGSKFGMDMRIVMPYSMVSTVVEYEEDRLIAWQPRPAYPVANRLAGGRIWRYELEPVEGGTRVRESWDVSKDHQRMFLKLGGLPERTRQNIDKTLAKIDELVSGAS
jgi:uncharacterized protein YndB with AHSA1/START domain